MLDVLAITVGTVGGLVAVLLRKIIEVVHSFFFGPIFSTLPGGEYRLILLPVLGALIVGPIVFLLAPEVRGEGIPTVMESLHTKGGKIRKRAGFVLMLTSAIVVGSGGSAGRDSPIAQIGASFGSLIGQGLRLTISDIEILTICGLVAGLAGTFNAPLGCAIFGMEVIIRRFRLADTVPILLSAVIGAAVASSFLGKNPAFEIPIFYLPFSDLWLCLILGLVFGILSFLWVKLFYKTEGLFEWLPLPEKLKPALGGVVAGVGGLYFLGYGIMGVGYEGINHIFDILTDTASANRPELLLLLVSLGLVKALATASCLGSGGSGGSIAPTLYMGTMFGATLGILFGEALPTGVHPVTFALLGAGALFAGAARAPLTCIVLIPEMSASYSMLPAMMFSCAMSFAVAHILLGGSSIYTLKLERKGVRLETGEAVLDNVSVAEAMKHDVVTVSPEMSIKEVRDYVSKYNYRGFPVVLNNELIGIIAFDDIRKIPENKQGEIRVGNVAISNVIVAYPDENMKQIMDRLFENNIGRLPVVERDNPKKIVGIVTRTDAISAYETTVTGKKD